MGGVPIPRPARERTLACALVISDSRRPFRSRSFSRSGHGSTSRNTADLAYIQECVLFDRTFYFISSRYGRRKSRPTRRAISVDKAKDTSPKKPITESKIVEAKTESSPKTENKPDVAPRRQAMGEGQKPESKAYKDNWNDIFAKKKKR